MESEIDSTIKICIEVIIASLLIGMVALLGSLSYSAYNGATIEKSTSDYLEAKSKLYYYDNREVSGSDIAEAILTHSRTYDYYIKVYDGLGELLEERQMKKGDEHKEGYDDYRDFWSEARVRTFVKGLEQSKFVATLVPDKYNSGIEAILFTKKEG